MLYIHECFIKTSSDNIRPNCCSSSTCCTLCSWRTNIGPQLNKLWKKSCPWKVEASREHLALQSNVMSFNVCKDQSAQVGETICCKIKWDQNWSDWSCLARRFHLPIFFSDNTCLLFETYVSQQNTLWLSIWLFFNLNFDFWHTQYDTVSNQSQLFSFTSVLHN